MHTREHRHGVTQVRRIRNRRPTNSIRTRRPLHARRRATARTRRESRNRAGTSCQIGWRTPQRGTGIHRDRDRCTTGGIAARSRVLIESVVSRCHSRADTQTITDSNCRAVARARVPMDNLTSATATTAQR